MQFLTDKQAITPYQQKWVVKMLGYDYSVVYRRGNQNTIVDALSRKEQSTEVKLFHYVSSIAWSEV